MTNFQIILLCNNQLFCVLAGYVANFQVDCRDGTSIATRMCNILDDFNVPGICVYADNAFVSVDMLRWCKQKKINLCGTTRRTYGFPVDLQFDGMQVNMLCVFFTTHSHTQHTYSQVGDFDWRMTDDGLLAVAWLDVGKTKAMSNFHSPETACVERRVAGQSERVIRTAPRCMVDYNQYMGGTDLCDQRRGTFSTQRKSKKWWRSLFYFSLDILMVIVVFVLPRFHHTDTSTHTQQLNAWAVYNWENNRSMSQKEFIVQVAKGILSEIDHPDRSLYSGDSETESPDLLSPTARVTPAMSRFVCRLEFGIRVWD